LRQLPLGTENWAFLRRFGLQEHKEETSNDFERACYKENETKQETKDATKGQIERQ
jgi:hypothetical protein